MTGSLYCLELSVNQPYGVVFLQLLFSVILFLKFALLARLYPS
jgi:hypothetical protein